MKIQRKIWNYILILVLGMMGMITIIFFLVEKLLLGDGRCYIPQRAIMIALMLCVFWQVALITVACLLGRRIKKKSSKPFAPVNTQKHCISNSLKYNASSYFLYRHIDIITLLSTFTIRHTLWEWQKTTLASTACVMTQAKSPTLSYRLCGRISIGKYP